MIHPFLRTGLLLALLLVLPAGLPAARAQQALEGQITASDSLLLTLERALDIALSRNYTLRSARLDVRNADAQIQEAWGQLYPQISLNSSYNRNVVTANPFAGSDFLSFFGGGSGTDWAVYNERARFDDDPSSRPITLDEFEQRQRDAIRAAGISLGGSSNPFGIANQFQNGITLEQTLFNGSAFAAIQGAQQLRAVNARGVDRQHQVLVRDVRQAFYQALLAQAQAEVADESVERARETLREISRKVERGTLAKYQRLGAEVELANRQTQLVEARSEAGTAADELKFVLGLPVDQPVALVGALNAEQRGTYADVTVEDAVDVAFAQRPDLKQARLTVDLREVNKNIAQATYLPEVSALANFNYSGRVPDDRTRILTDPTDPFFYDTNTLGFFADSYWNPSLSVGLQLTWTIFNGFQRDAVVEQRSVDIRKAEIQYHELRQQVRMDVQGALRNLAAARLRIDAQVQNVERAETNYRFTRQRVETGVSTLLEVREASEQLDTAHLSYLQAVYDYLAARAAFETAIGQPLDRPATFIEDQ